MIVRTFAARLQLVTQPDHAHLARRVMEQVLPLRAHPRRESILRATGEHDAAWDETDAAPAIDPASGAVVDFIRAPLAVRQGVWPRSVARLRDDPWAAALVAQHAVVAYARFREAPEWAAFFAEMEGTRDALLGAAGLPLDELLADYPFLRLGDLVSLAFCTGSRESQQYGEWTVTGAGDRVAVAPDPFGDAEVTLAVEAHELDAVRFGSDAELRDALRGARRVSLRGVAAA